MTLDPLLQAGGRRDAPVIYLDEDPGECGEVYLDEPPCQQCHRGILTREHSKPLGGEMLTCRGGCSQRFWLDR